jgi:hypothetical protein
MRLLILSFVLVGCGRVGVSNSKHTIGGEATVRVIVEIDVTACDGLEPAAKAECVEALVSIAKEMAEKANEN